MALYAVVAVALFGSCWAAPPVDSDQVNYDVDVDTWDLNTYGETYDYDDLDEEVDNARISVGTMASPAVSTHLPPENVPENKTDEMTPLPQTTRPTIHPTLDFQGPGLFGPDTGLGMPTCLLCVCLSGSVYCDDAGLTEIPPLPKDTTHLYARFNKITAVKAKDFLNLNQLKRIDLTGNQIYKLDDDTFHKLPQLQDLFLADNRIPSLPELPVTMRYIDNNNIQSLNEDTFCNSHDLSYIRKPLEDIRLDGNPVDVNRYAWAYVCLPRMPVGNSH
ncbi:Epiphycan [Bagarius yarrelli]|uniref:Epiphycan n=1 Tax=Bagarius yarrelli TaxID=175774 RepID=A0A556V3Z9_BAGYA|nr:Epiphycan [Bagarius yarrelli]